jgi:hypothetical protein
MRCPVTSFDCLTCEEVCIAALRRKVESEAQARAEAVDLCGVCDDPMEGAVECPTCGWRRRGEGRDVTVHNAQVLWNHVTRKAKP